MARHSGIGARSFGTGANAPVAPDERWGPGHDEHAFAFADLASRCKVDGFDAGSRVDPYWDALWSVGSTGSWTTQSMARLHARAGYGALPRELMVDQAEALDRFFSTTTWQTRLALLGALHAWRTASAEQLAAFTGSPLVADATRRHIATAFAAGLVDLGVYANGLRRSRLTGRGALLRPSKGNVFEREIVHRLSHAEWLSVTGGQTWNAHGVYDRHNILATELGLRFAEYGEIGTVLGERFSTIDLLGGSGVGLPEIIGSQRSADLTVVRGDGMRVAFEVTATTSMAFRSKVREWMRLLHSQPIELNGLCVVFLVVATPETVGDKTLPTRREVYREVLAALKEFPGSSFNPVASRVGVATWREWFPARHRISEDFFTLRVDAPTGRLDGDPSQVWQPMDLLDRRQRPFDPSPHLDPTAVIANSAALGQTPHWLREDHAAAAPDLWRIPQLRAGGGQLPTIPHPTPTRPDRARGKRLGAGWGVSGDATPPSRLLGLT